jgi:hypothetical protein
MNRKICISNLVYGEIFTKIFLTYHLKSLLENLSSSRLPDGSIYLVFTDQKTISELDFHKNVAAVRKFMPLEIVVIDGELKNDMRYHIQSMQMKETIKYCLENDLLIHQTCADVYFGSNFFQNLIQKMSEGFDVIFGNPMRAAYESAAPLLDHTIYDVDDLFEIGFQNPHPVWMSSNWNNPYFSTTPYHILWSDSKSILVRGVSISVYLVEPREWMLEFNGCTDMIHRKKFKHPYYCVDWSELPILELVFLATFFPPFRNQKSSVSSVAEWIFLQNLSENINIDLYTICKRTSDNIDIHLIDESKKIMENIFLEVISLNISKNQQKLQQD